MTASLSDAALDTLFRKARTRNGWLDRPVAQALLHEIYELAKWGPTSANASPGRFLFLTTQEAKARLEPHLAPGNRDKTMAAPVVVIISYDLDFAEQIPKLLPHNPGAKALFADPQMAEEAAFRNGTLQGAYLMLAARAFGLDCGPMSGFDRSGVDAEFFAGSRWRSNFICNLGYGSDVNLFERLPRLPFDDACAVL